MRLATGLLQGHSYSTAVESCSASVGSTLQAIVPKYVSLMRELGFSGAVPLYVASALLSYQDAAGSLPCRASWTALRVPFPNWRWLCFQQPALRLTFALCAVKGESPLKSVALT
jgi:hypothetical protein